MNKRYKKDPLLRNVKWSGTQELPLPYRGLSKSTLISSETVVSRLFTDNNFDTEYTIKSTVDYGLLDFSQNKTVF
jgi:hypothetical protein